jgi:hypothetical protein
MLRNAKQNGRAIRFNLLVVTLSLHNQKDFRYYHSRNFRVKSSLVKNLLCHFDEGEITYYILFYKKDESIIKKIILRSVLRKHNVISPSSK